MSLSDGPSVKGGLVKQRTVYLWIIHISKHSWGSCAKANTCPWNGSLKGARLTSLCKMVCQPLYCLGPLQMFVKRFCCRKQPQSLGLTTLEFIILLASKFFFKDKTVHLKGNFLSNLTDWTTSRHCGKHSFACEHCICFAANHRNLCISASSLKILLGMWTPSCFEDFIVNVLFCLTCP